MSKKADFPTTAVTQLRDAVTQQGMSRSQQRADKLSSDLATTMQCEQKATQSAMNTSCRTRSLEQGKTLIAQGIL
ncbi:hypothetical protein [Klebsiella quasipneumoniae]